MNKILSLKSNAIFLAIVLVAGTIALSSPSFITNVQAQQEYNGIDNKYSGYEPTRGYPPQYTETEYNSYQPSYEMDPYESTPSYGNENNYYEPREYTSYQKDYKPDYPSYGKDSYKSKKDTSNSVSINKLNCINNNVNINGNNTGDINVGNSGSSATGSGTAQGYLGVGSVGNNGEEGYDNNGYNKQKDKGFKCIINNNNNNTVVGGEPPEPLTATLNVIKKVTCTYYTGGLQGPPCEQLENRITEDQFLIQVTNDNPDPSSFDGSESGTVVTLGPGNYVVSETPDASVQIDVSDLEADFRAQSGIPYEITGPIPSFTGDCTPVNAGFEATGTIGAGESQTCEIENHFDIRESPGIAQVTGDSSTIAQGTQDTSALANIAKLKAQWLDLLP